jgi:hypothetical protein
LAPFLVLNIMLVQLLKEHGLTMLPIEQNIQAVYRSTLSV